MNTQTGIIYDTREQAEAAGGQDEDLVTGSSAALKKLKKKLERGSFKNSPPVTAGGKR